MFRAYTRLTLLLLAILLCLIYIIRGDFIYAAYLSIAAFLLGLSHIWFANIWQAFTAIRRGNTLLADRILNMVLRVDWLRPRARAYYFFVKGMLSLRANRLEEGKTQLLRALEGPLSSEKDRALAALNLAHIAYVQKNWDDCQKWVDVAQQTDANDLLIKEHIKKLTQAIPDSK